MPILSKSILRSQVAQKSVFDATRELRDFASRALKSADRYDVFLSHRYLDAPEILALKTFLESFGFSVFVDWIANPELDRGQVTRESAGLLRDAMKRSASLLYAVSGSSSDSKWMPWELGYSDAFHEESQLFPSPITKPPLRATRDKSISLFTLSSRCGQIKSGNSSFGSKSRARRT